MALKGAKQLENSLIQIAKKLRKAQSVKIGFFEGDTEADGTPVALVAAMNEYGAPALNRPPRPFFRNAIAAHKASWTDLVIQAVKSANYDTQKALAMVGDTISGQVQTSIIDGNYAPLSPVTIAKKGFDKALIETGTMLRSITYKVS